MTDGSALLACARLIEEGVSPTARNEQHTSELMAELRADAESSGLTLDCVAAIYIAEMFKGFTTYVKEKCAHS